MDDHDEDYESAGSPSSGSSSGGFVGWLKAHPQLTLAVGVVAVLLIAASFLKKNQQTTGQAGGLQQSDNGITTLPSGYSVVPTSGTDASTNSPSYTAPDNTAATIGALADFVSAVSPQGVGSPTTTTTTAPETATTTTTAPETTTTSDPNSTASDLGALQSLATGLGIPTAPTIIPTPTPTVVHNKAKPPTATHHAKGTPNQGPGTPVVAKHPANPSPLPPTRSVPVTHPAQGKNHPVAAPVKPLPTPVVRKAVAPLPQKVASKPVVQRPAPVSLPHVAQRVVAAVKTPAHRKVG